MRLSLPPGAVLQGKKHRYTVKNMICLSERSITLLCSSEVHKDWRLKYYNGDNAVTEEMLKKLLSIEMRGVVLPMDIGTHAGVVFAVFPVLEVTSADRFPIPLELLADSLIPKLFSIINKYHEQGILLRDICPEHLLYKPDMRQIAYCGFGNAVELTEGTNRTKSSGYGQHFSYLAPEVESLGYSAASDYFSLGMTILTLVEGKNPIESLTREEFMTELSAGRAPGIDTGHLLSMPYAWYGAEDRILYLALGLLTADPQKRWGVGELRCWCAGQEIPLRPRGKKTNYQFTEPFLVSGKKCWNEKELARVIAAEKEAWHVHTVGELATFSKRQRLKGHIKYSEYAQDQTISPKGKVFRCIYTLDASLDGLWWDGNQYADMSTLADAAKQSRAGVDAFSQLLKDQCFSFFGKMRAEHGGFSAERLADLEKMERWEREETGKGLYRCMMKFAPSARQRFFQVEGKRYTDMRQLLIDYQNDGGRLWELSLSILSDRSFEAWLWAHGMERAGEEAARLSRKSPAQSFFLLLSLCESLAEEDDTKKLVRRFYLSWGDYAPIVWLSEHIANYRMTSPIHRILYDTFQNAAFPLNESLEVLQRRAQGLVTDYQTFASRTRTPNVGDAYAYGYYPLYEDGYFRYRWRNGLEVSGGFLKSVGE